MTFIDFMNCVCEIHVCMEVCFSIVAFNVSLFSLILVVKFTFYIKAKRIVIYLLSKEHVIYFLL